VCFIRVGDKVYVATTIERSKNEKQQRADNNNKPKFSFSKTPAVGK
jgi:hypothetical protein